MGDWDDDSDKVAMTPEAIEVRARMAQEWAERYVGELAYLRWTVRQHFEHDVPALLAVASAYRATQAATPDGPRRWALPDDRETAKAAIHRPLHDLNVRIVGLAVGDCHCNLIAEVVLDALTDATPAADGQDGDGHG